MQKMREESMRQPPNPAYKIRMDPSPKAKVILFPHSDHFPVEEKKNEEQVSPGSPILPFPSLASSLKKKYCRKLQKILRFPFLHPHPFFHLFLAIAARLRVAKMICCKLTGSL